MDVTLRRAHSGDLAEVVALARLWESEEIAGILRFYERHGYRGWGIQLFR